MTAIIANLVKNKISEINESARWKSTTSRPRKFKLVWNCEDLKIVPFLMSEWPIQKIKCSFNIVNVFPYYQ